MEFDIASRNEVVCLIVGSYEDWQGCMIVAAELRYTYVESLISDCSFVSSPKCIDVVPCTFTCKRDLVRGDSSDLAILLVDLPLSPNKLTSQESVDKWQSGSGPELWTGKSRERMEV